MNTTNSEDKSQSHTTDSEYQERLEKIRNFKYPSMPNRNHLLKNENQNKIKIATNLFEIKFQNIFHNLTLFNIEVRPPFDESNFSLRRLIYYYIETHFPKYFKKNFFGGNVLYSFIYCENEEDKNTFNKIQFNETIKEKEYTITLTKIKEVKLEEVNDFSGQNQKIKLYIETLIRNIVMKNKNVIYFKDRTLFEININNITRVTHDSDESIYRGYMTSANITENGLFLLINNINKVISGKTVLQKIREIETKYQHLPVKEIQNQIKSYFENHRTVITTYGVPRAYKINNIDFDLDPKTLSIMIDDNEQRKKKITVTLYDYYKKKYNMEIKLKQPLIEAKRKKKKKNEDGKKIDNEEHVESKIYLIPEFLFITGSEDDSNNFNKQRRERNLKDKTKMNPDKKMKLIKGFLNLYNSTNKKIIKKENQNYQLKSPKELAEEWGIKIVNNLSFQGKIISPPKLNFLDKNNKIVETKINNGLFTPGIPFRKINITENNLFVIYDNNDPNIKYINIRDVFFKLCEKFVQKGIEKFDNTKVPGYRLYNTNKWETIEEELRKLPLYGKKELFGIIFCSNNLENNYGKLKEYFLKNCNIPTQHILTRNLIDKKGNLNPLLFNIVDQINVKNGGMNYYIDFKKENIIRQNDDNKFLIIGLDSKYYKDQITYSMTSSKHPKLNLFTTQEKTVNKKVKQEKINALKTMFETAIQKLEIIPDYIIMYRQGGNEYHNKCLAVDELNIFKDVLKEKNKQNTFLNTKFYYICCNLKSDLKFFEEEEKNNSDTNCKYKNPLSGLIIDEYVTQKNKFEFYLQPQYVNQGTATPSHYQVMYYDEQNNSLDMEKLEKLTYYLTYYYWTWHGAIRIPAILKFSTTALDFYLKCFNSNEQFGEYNFEKPYYI